MDRRGAQLQRRHKAGPSGPGQRLCADCRALLDELSDVEVACRNEGCSGHFIWKRGSQLRARRAGEADSPPERMCPECDRFLKEHPVKELACKGCGATIRWSTDNQLKTHLGLWTEPELCGECLAQQRSDGVPGEPDQPPEEPEDGGPPATA